MESYQGIVERLKGYADACIYLTDREQLFHESRKQRIILHEQLQSAFELAPEFVASLGLTPGRGFEVHALRRAVRLRPDGSAASQIFVSMTQTTTLPGDQETGSPGPKFRGGSTLVVDLAAPDVPKYRITKSISDSQRREAAGEFHRSVQADPLRRLFFSADREEPFAALHELAEGQA